MIYLDANVLIRLLESDPQSRLALQSKLKGRGGFLTSELSRLECRCGPIKRNDAALLSLYDAMFQAAEMKVCPLDRQVIDKATELRASTKLRTPDSIHLAAAVIYGATCFCTGDLHFKSVTLMPVEIL